MIRRKPQQVCPPYRFSFPDSSPETICKSENLSVFHVVTSARSPIHPCQSALAVPAPEPLYACDKVHAGDCRRGAPCPLLQWQAAERPNRLPGRARGLDMYNAQSTPYPDESDLLAFEVFVGLADRPSRYLSDDLKDQLAGAARYCSGEMPGPELLQLFSLVGVHLCEQATSVADADGELTSCLCWFAIRRDAEAPKAQARWFDGRQLAAIYLVGVPWIPQGQSGYLGRLERNFRTAIHGSQEFAAYRVARQRLADRIAARRADHRPIAEQLRDFEARLISALVRRSAGE